MDQFYVSFEFCFFLFVYFVFSLTFIFPLLNMFVSLLKNHTKYEIKFKDELSVTLQSIYIREPKLNSYTKLNSLDFFYFFIVTNVPR